MLTPLSGPVRERTWKRGCRLEYSIQYFLTAAPLLFIPRSSSFSVIHVSVDTNI